MCSRLGLWLVNPFHPYWLPSDFLDKGPPHGFGKHTCAVPPEDLLIFQIVRAKSSQATLL